MAGALGVWVMGSRAVRSLYDWRNSAEIFNTSPAFFSVMFVDQVSRKNKKDMAIS